MKKVALLGGTRFIGYHLLRALHREGYKVTIFNRGITPTPDTLPTNIKYIRGNRNRPEDFRNLFCQKFDTVFDLSGYTLNHVEPIVRNYRSSIGHYIFCSTSSVYKTPPPCPSNEESPRFFTVNTYGGNKALVENLLLKKYKEDRWPVTIVRPQGVFGPYDAHQAWFIFYRLLHSIPISVRPKENYRINFLYVNDLIEGFLLIMNNIISHGEVYCVAGDDVTSQLEFIELCEKVTSSKPVLHFVDNPVYDGLKVGVPWLEYDLVADNSKIKKELGLNFTPLETALAKTLSWLIRNLEHQGSCWFRGERYVLRNRPIPKIVKAYWKLVDSNTWIINILKQQKWLRKWLRS